MSKLFKKTIEQTLLSFDIEIRDAKALKKELESNFLDHKDALVAQGMDPRKATREVVKRFGDPVVIGKMFRKYSLTAKSIRQTRILATIIGSISMLIGLYYGLSTKWLDIRYWSILAVIGGIAAIIASKTISQSKLWRYGAIFGFFLMAVGQIVPMFGGVILIESLVAHCQAAYVNHLSPNTFCLRQNEIFLGLGVHFLLLVLCFWIVYEIFRQRDFSVSAQNGESSPRKSYVP